MLIKLVEVKRGMRGGSASLSEIYINPAHIVSVSEDLVANESMISEAIAMGLVKDVKFSKVIITEGNQSKTLTVVGTPHEVYGKIKKKQVLRG